MTALAEHVYEGAINLDPIDRAELIEKLFESFFHIQNTDIELKWKEEVGRRRIAYDNGDIPSDSMENVFTRLAQR